MQQVSICLCIAFTLISMITYCSSENKRASTRDPMDVYFQEYAESVEKSTPEQLQAHIKEANIALERLQKVIESDETNPEEQFEAIRTRNHILKERDICLDALANKKTSPLEKEY